MKASTSNPYEGEPGRKARLYSALERTRQFEKECKKAWEKDVDNPHKREYDVLGMSDALMEQILIWEELNELQRVL